MDWESQESNDISEEECQKTLEPNVFIMGMMENVKPCYKFRMLLEIDREILPLPSLLSIIEGAMRGKNYLKVPLKVAKHFAPYKRIEKSQILEILAQHIRFKNASYRYMFLNPQAVCTIRITDFGTKRKQSERKRQKTYWITHYVIRVLVFITRKILEHT